MSKAYICRECNGKGEVIYVWELPSYKPVAVLTCSLCGGLGFVDWVENVIKRPKQIYRIPRWMEEKEILSKWREVSLGRWEEIAENRRGKEIGISSKGDGISYGKV